MTGSEKLEKVFLLPEALKAQTALRDAAGMGPEHFPLKAFVGMISDEVQVLRERGWSDAQIADCIVRNSAIDISAAEITENYATEEQRHGG